MAPPSYLLSPVPSENRDPNVHPRTPFPPTPTPPPSSSNSKYIRFLGNTYNPHACSFSSPPSSYNKHHTTRSVVMAASRPRSRKRSCRVLLEEKHAPYVVETKSRIRRRHESGDSDVKEQQEQRVSIPFGAACRKASDIDGIRNIVHGNLTGIKKNSNEHADGCNNAAAGGIGSNKAAGGSSSEESGDERNSPDKATTEGGDWNLKAVLKEFGGLTTRIREGRRLKRLQVRESEKSVTDSNPSQHITYLPSSASDHRLRFIKCKVSSDQPLANASLSSSHTTIAASVVTTPIGDKRLKTAPGAKSATNRPLSPSTNRKDLVDHVQFPAAPQRRRPINSRSCITPQAGSKPDHETRADVQLIIKTPRSASSRPRPFKLLTEERGKLKKEEFVAKLKQMMAEEERHRIPLAQGLPWTTDEPDVPRKPQMKENTVPLDIQLNSDLRATERAEFDRCVSEKLLHLEQKRLQAELLRKVEMEQAIKKMRQEMVPRAQPMPYFDRPFRPKRSSKQLTIPKEPHFHHNSKQSSTKRQKCVASSYTLLR